LDRIRKEKWAKFKDLKEKYQEVLEKMVEQERVTGKSDF